MRAAIVGALVVAGCSGSTTITVELAFDPPDFIAYRDGTSTWTTPAPLSGGTYAAHHYTFEAIDDYEVVAVWLDASSGTAISSELFATTQDAASWYLGSNGASAVDDVVTAPPTDRGCSRPDMPFDLSGTIVASGAMT